MPDPLSVYAQSQPGKLAVIDDKPPEIVHPGPVVVPHQHLGFVDERISTGNNTMKHLYVTATTGGRSHVEGDVEQPDRVEDGSTEGHVRADAEAARPEQVARGCFAAHITFLP